MFNPVFEYSHSPLLRLICSIWISWDQDYRCDTLRFYPCTLSILERIIDSRFLPNPWPWWLAWKRLWFELCGVTLVSYCSDDHPDSPRLHDEATELPSAVSFIAPHMAPAVSLWVRVLRGMWTKLCTSVWCPESVCHYGIPTTSLALIKDSWSLWLKPQVENKL